jgi:hypothetical protein
MYQVIQNILSIESPKFKLNIQNLSKKIHIHKICTSIQCDYSINADHIIDVQCNGAHNKIPAQTLRNIRSKFVEDDLLFLDIKEKIPI